MFALIPCCFASTCSSRRVSASSSALSIVCQPDFDNDSFDSSTHSRCCVSPERVLLWNGQIENCAEVNH
jgi:hypothetical protein